MRFRVCAVVAVSSLFAQRAGADGDGDGVYGRLQGDLTFVAGAGGGVATSSLAARPFLSADARLRYLEAAGATLGYEETLGSASEAGTLRRAFLAGVELRPLFPARFLKARETGHRFGDLLLDSFALDVGVWAPILEASDVRRCGYYVGLALEAPLIGNVSGLWLRLSTSMRWTPTRLEGADDPGGRVFVVGLGLAFHQMFGPHLVQRGDERVQ